MRKNVCTLDPVDEYVVVQPTEVNGKDEIDDPGVVDIENESTRKLEDVKAEFELLTKLMREVFGDVVKATKVNVV